MIGLTLLLNILAFLVGQLTITGLGNIELGGWNGIEIDLRHGVFDTEIAAHHFILQGKTRQGAKLVIIFLVLRNDVLCILDRKG